MQIAKTVLAVASAQNPLVSLILNRSNPLSFELAQIIMSQTQFSYHGRKPKPARIKTGLIRKTNLDLLSLLVDLYKRSARVSLTSYDNQLPWNAYACEQHVGGTKRYGHICGLISHREHLSFSLQINDESVLSSSGPVPTLGSARTYMIADYYGAWHKGWHGFSWDMTEDEKAYLLRRNILVNDNVDCEDYIHHNRRQSIMGAPYLLLKLLWQRIEDEISFYESEIKRLEQSGIERPSYLHSDLRFKIASGESASVEVPTFTVKLSGLRYNSEYKKVSSDENGYVYAHQNIGFLMNKLRPIVQFVVRADEVAFYRFGLKKDYVASWIKNSKWVHVGPHIATISLGDTLQLIYKKGMVEKKVAAKTK